MLYNYYMKKWFSWLAVAVLLPLCAQAQMSVVRIDGQNIYLDISDEKTAPVKGSTFKVIVSSEPLTNPKTGKNLGEIYHYSAAGTVTEVHPLYVVGKLTDTKGVTVGKQAVWEEIAPAVPAQAAFAAAPTKAGNLAYTTSAPLAQEVIGITQADVTAPGAKNIITLSSESKITVFSRTQEGAFTPQLAYMLPVGKKGLSVSAASVKPGLAQIFVAVLEESQNRLTTWVLENQHGQLTKTETLAYYVKELGCGANKKIWAQRPFVLGDNPGNAHELVFEKNKFVPSGAKFNTRHHWLSGLAYYPVVQAQQDNLIITAPNGALRMFLENGKTAESKDLFGSSPLRVQYKQQILKFYPALQAYDKDGKATLAAVENGTKLGLLSETFGQYRGGKIHLLNYQNGALQVIQTAELDGVLYDTTCTDTSLVSAEVLPDGTSRIVEILK